MEAKLSTGTLMKADDLKLLLERLDRLRPDAKPAWGTLDAPRMLCHLGDGLRVALGEIPAVPRHSWLSRTLGRFVVVQTGFQPPRGKVQTAPEMLTSRPTSWQADLDACKQLAARVGSGRECGAPGLRAAHSGGVGQAQLEAMSYHLRQFQVWVGRRSPAATAAARGIRAGAVRRRARRSRHRRSRTPASHVT